MPKYRKLYTKALESLDINDMPDDFTRLFWVLLPLVCDREGRGLDNSFWLKSRVFPLRSDITPMRIDQAMDWFCSRGMVSRYEVESRSYFWLPTFAEYQGDTSKEAESNYPPPPDVLKTNSGPTPDLLLPKSASDSDSDATTDSDTDAKKSDGADAAPIGAPPPPPTRKPRAKQEKTPKEPPPPAVEAFRSATGRYPHKTLWPGIVEVVGADPPEVERFQRTCTAYVAMGWNPNNVKGMLQFQARHEIPGDGNGHGKGPPIDEPKSWPAIREAMRRHEAGIKPPWEQ